MPKWRNVHFMDLDIVSFCFYHVFMRKDIDEEKTRLLIGCGLVHPKRKFRVDFGAKLILLLADWTSGKLGT